MKPSGYTGLVLIIVGFLAMPVACMVVFGSSFASRGIAVVPETTFGLASPQHIAAHDAPNLQTPQNIDVWLDVSSGLAKSAGAGPVAVGRLTAKDAAATVLVDIPLAFTGAAASAPYVDGGPSSTTARINIHAPVFTAPASGEYTIDVEVHATTSPTPAPPTTQVHLEVFSARDSPMALLPLLLPMAFVFGGIALAIVGRKRSRPSSSSSSSTSTSSSSTP